METAVLVAVIGAVVTIFGSVIGAVTGFTALREGRREKSRLADIEERKVGIDVFETQLVQYRSLIEAQSAEMTRLREERDQSRREAQTTAEQVLGALADTVNKNTESNFRMADAFREFSALTAQSRAAMKVAVEGVSAGQVKMGEDLDAITAKIDAVMEEIRSGNGKHGEQLDAIHELIQQLVEMAGQNTP